MTDNTKISDDYLFHFTNDIKHIENIMIDGFKPFYCLERLSYIDFMDNKNGKYIEMAFPVVCFCDLPVSLQNTHRKKFGRYGIKLKKKWGIDNHLSPIVYTNEKAITSVVLKNLIEFYEKINEPKGWVFKLITILLKPFHILKSLDGFQSKTWCRKKLKPHKIKNHLQGLKNNMSYLLMYYKPYEGYQYIKDEKKFDNKISRFYDEREWRYLPTNCDDLKLNLERHEYENKSELKKENSKIQKNNHLKFSLNDLHSIYLTKESEIEAFLKSISSKYQPTELSVIKEKIIINNEK